MPEPHVISEIVGGILDDDDSSVVRERVPPWANRRLSASLPSVRATGEGQVVEFIVKFPDQPHELAKELAAFGTSGGGSVYIGIDDSGDLVGIGALDAAARDKLAVRAQHIAVGTVDPPLQRIEVDFAVEGTATVLVICIPQQDTALFYSNQRAYIRDKRISRPATPDEVEKSIWAHRSSEYHRERERMKLEHDRQFMQDMLESSRRHDEQMRQLRSRGIRGG